jgi:hypothetical protein
VSVLSQLNTDDVAKPIIPKIIVLFVDIVVESVCVFSCRQIKSEL